MSTYTLRGSEALDAQIDLHLNRIVDAVSGHCQSVILTGGYGRGEGTPFIHPDGTQSPFNDYDLIVIVKKLDEPARNLFRGLERQLTDELGITVDLCPYAMNRLSACEFSLLNYEMMQGHKVLYGNRQVLDALPDYPHNAVPFSEGTRLLLNRGKLLLDIRLRLAEPEPLTEEERIRFLKFISKVWLAIGDSALLAARMYDIHYAVKSERISDVGRVPHRAEVIDEYLKAIELRNGGDYHSCLHGLDIAEAFNRARDVFVDFLAWYRAEYPGREGSLIKAMLLNLKWNRWPYLSHPRRRLYDALPELLKDQPDRILLGQILSCSDPVEQRFYDLQKRFS
jgi:hypothetical protein